MKLRLCGFTLIELMVVLAIIATLLALVAPRYFHHVDRSREAVLLENLTTLRDAIDQYHADKGTWPQTLDSLAAARYLRKVPDDPLTNRNDTWQTTPPPDGSAGLYDVFSGAPGNDRNGRPYAEW